MSFGLASTSVIHLAICRISASFMPRVVSAGVPMRMPDGSSGLRGSNGIMFLLTVMPAASRACSACLPVTPLAVDVHEHQVVVGPAGDERGTRPRCSSSASTFALAITCAAYVLERRLQRLAEGDRLRRDDVHERPALHAGEDGRVDLVGPLLLAEDEAAARPAQRLVRGAGHEVGVRHRVGVELRRDQPGDVGHVDHEQRPDLLADLGELGEVEHPRVGAGPGDDQLRLVLAGLGRRAGRSRCGGRPCRTP